MIVLMSLPAHELYSWTKLRDEATERVYQAYMHKKDGIPAITVSGNEIEVQTNSYRATYTVEEIMRDLPDADYWADESRVHYGAGAKRRAWK